MSATEKIVKYLLVRIIFYSGLPMILREFIQRRRVTILVFHDPHPAAASGYFNWLSRHYNIISLDQYLSAHARDVGASLPPKALVITLDDGHIENYKLLQLVKQYKIPLTIFLCSGIVNTNRHYWFRYAGLPATSESLKMISEDDRLRVLYQLGFYPEKEFPYPHALNREQIMEMQEYISFQGHTIFDPCLPGCSDQKSLEEIEQSKKQLERDFNLSINALAYPNGEYTSREVQFAQQAGYRCAVTISHGFNNGNTDLYRLRRLSVGDSDSIELLAIKASGIWAFLKYVVNKFTRRQDSIKLKLLIALEPISVEAYNPFAAIF